MQRRVVDADVTPAVALHLLYGQGRAVVVIADLARAPVEHRDADVGGEALDVADGADQGLDFLVERVDHGLVIGEESDEFLVAEVAGKAAELPRHPP